MATNSITTSEVLIAFFCAASAVSLIACALFARRGKALDEANGVTREQAEPECAGTICAWCHPGVDHPGGHGICPSHAREFVAQAEKLRKAAK